MFWRSLPTFGHSSTKPARVLVRTSAPPKSGRRPRRRPRDR
jgi:hypothetical protein